MRKKYGMRINREADSYTAEVIRRGTSRGTTVERVRTGFKDYEEARVWAAAALAEYVALRQHRSARRKGRKQWSRLQQKLESAWLAAQTHQGLAQALQGEHAGRAAELLKDKADILWREVAFRVLKNGADEQCAVEIANEQVGRNWTERVQKARAGDLDAVYAGVTRMAVANAQRLSDWVLKHEGRPKSE